MSNQAPNTVRRRWAVVLVLLAALVVAGLAVVLSGGSDGPVSAVGINAVVPSDALAEVTLSLSDTSPAVKQGLAVGNRLPNFGLAGAEVLGRFGEALAGGRAIDFSSQVSRWAGNAGALVLLNSTTSTAGSLIVVEVAHAARARAFVRSEDAASDGSYRGTPLLAYPNGNVLAFVGSDLVVGQAASVRTAIDVAAGARTSLATTGAYRRATSGAPSDSVLTAYASPSGVRRVLAAQTGVLGALGALLYQPSLQGVSMAVVPTANGADVDIHSALTPGGQVAGAAPFTPTLQNVIPAGATLALDVSGLDRVLPQVLDAGSATGLSGDIGPLLSRLGSALSAEGVDVKQIVSLFSGESAVAIVPNGRTSMLVIVSRTSDQARAQAQLNQLQAPLTRLFRTSGGGRAPGSVFSAHQVAGVTAHSFQLTPTLQLDDAVVHGMVVVSTSLNGIADVARAAHPLARQSSFATALSGHPAQVTSLVFADLGALLRATGSQLSSSATFQRVLPDLERIGAIGLSATRGSGEATAQLSIQVR